MIILGAAAGWWVGVWLGWAADFLPRYATSVPVTRAKSASLVKPALFQLLAALRNQKDLRRLPQSMWLNLGTEFSCALLFAYLWGLRAPSVDLVLQSVLGSFLILVVLIDVKYRLILNVLVLPAMVLTLLIRGTAPGTNLLAVVIGGAFGFAILALAAFLRPGELGGGDVKLATLIGLVFGFPNALWALLVGILAGGVVAILLLFSHRGSSKTQMPYAPFLCFGALIALFYNPVSSILHPLIGH